MVKKKTSKKSPRKISKKVMKKTDSKVVKTAANKTMNKGVNKVNSSIMSKQDQMNKIVMHDFILGIILVVIVQVLFMFGGMLVEDSMGMTITGIPTSIGLTIVFLLGIYYVLKGREFILMGSSMLGFISPLLLYLIYLFKALPYNSPLFGYSIGYMSVVVIAIWMYFVVKISKNSL